MKRNKKQETRNRKLEIDIDHVAKLANLPLTPKEKVTFQKQLRDVLSYISKLNVVDTTKVEPIGHITGLVNIARQDEAAPSLSQKEVLSNAPKTDSGFFKVEAILDNQDN